MHVASTAWGWHQIKVFWDRSNSVRVQGHLPRPDEPARMRSSDPNATFGSLPYIVAAKGAGGPVKAAATA
jgi:hypothetical protein